jgi:hypothetical protein
MGNVEDIISELEKHGFAEVSEVRTFAGWRQGANGESQLLELDIHDEGPNAGDTRYTVVAHNTENEQETTGNPAATIDMALREVPWNELD